jgi:methylase of polypeptide subunit release factors
MSADVERIAAEQAPIVARELQRIAKLGGTEADFRREAARILEEAGSAAGLTIVPRDEFSVARGRVDSLYNRLVLEYKRPRVIRESNEGRTNQEIIQKLKEYIQDVGKRERREAQRLAGVALDGCYYIFVRRVGEGWSVDDPVAVNTASTERFLRLLFALSVGAAMVPENLVEDFGPKTLRAQRAVRALYAALHRSKQPLVLKLFEQWRQFFSEATEYKEWAARIESKEEFRTFVKGMGLDPKYAEAPKVFFALHTYYALLIKLVASLAAARFAGNESAPLTGLASKEGAELRAAFVDLERGGLFREYGIRNFLEGDFFGWYLTAWDEEIEEAISKLVGRLAEYDPGTLELAPENARDLLKKLYHYLLPREIRHDLGEYYTPDWLAERLIIQTLGKTDLGDARKRVLDPACGSGTFLVILIKYIREQAGRRGTTPAKTLELILQNIIGFDLNPLAVIAARTNYLLALGDLLKARKGDIDIPVYQADSVLTPSRGSDLFDGNVYPLKTSVGEFRVPAAFAEGGRMDALANALDECVESGVAPAVFMRRIEAAVSLTAKEKEAAQQDLEALYVKLRELHDEGLNGVWARIVKNSFAPLFIEPCDYIVGNPPWVNWESLPDEYRRSTMPLWEHYGLFPKRDKAMETILGAAKYDLSALMTYVSVDKYLRRAGRLGFVVTESLFKTVGAGQGFRRFTLPDHTPFGPLAVEDMVQLHPFEDAANRTAILIVTKGKKVAYPVSYSYWVKRKKGRGSTIGFETPYLTVTSEKITYRALYAQPVDKNDATSVWITGRPKAMKAVSKLLGKSDYQAREGVNSGGANAVFWVDVVGQRPGGLIMVSNVTEGAKKKVQHTQAAIEPDLLYPLLRAANVSRWKAIPEFRILTTHEPTMRLKAIPDDRMQDEYPKTYSYLKRFETVLRARAAFKRYFKTDAPFYSLFDIGDYTFAPWKVVWTRIGKVEAAVAGPLEGKPCIPQETVTLVECRNEDEAHYMAAAVNSAPFQFAVHSFSQKGGKSMGSMHVLRYARVPQFSAKEKGHQKLAELSRSAHEAAAAGELGEVVKIEGQIDHWAAKLWSLSDEELAEIKRSLEEV